MVSRLAPVLVEEIGFSSSSLRSAVVSVAPIWGGSYLIAGQIFDELDGVSVARIAAYRV